jgi:hypothetical protein
MVSLVLATAARAEGPPCLAQVEVIPARAVVGQQVAYVARLLRRPDVGTVSWVEGLSFPSLRAEWLPGLSGETRVRRQGTSYLVYEERRALFPLRAGRLEIPPASLRCALYAPPGGAGRSVAAVVPGTAVDVDEPSPSDRSRAWTGLVGPIELKLAAEPSAVTLGDTVRVTLTLAGEGNLWAAPPPFGPASFEGDGGLAAEVFARPPQLSVDAGERLHLRQSFAVELVPRRAGRMVIPSYEVSVFDPTQRRFTTEKTEPVEIVVAPRESGGAAGSGPATPPPSARSGSGEGSGASVALAVLGLLAVLVAGGAALLARRRRGALPARDTMRRALQEAARARRAGDLDAEQRALVRALRVGLERALCADAKRSSGGPVATPGLSADELAARAQGDETLATAAEILQADERARFAARGELPDAPRLRAAADRLARRT